MRPASIIIMALFIPAAALPNPVELGYTTETHVLEPEGEEICPGTVLLQQDDGSFENGYLWHFGGVVPPDYGSWAECFISDFVCGVQFAFTQTYESPGYTMDVYVWESDADGSPPPGPDPGNVICVLPDIDPDPIAYWPEISLHNVQICCETGGPHFVGFWPNWPGGPEVWFIAADENGPGFGCPRTKIAPGLGYPTGWNHPNIVPTFNRCDGLGIREFAGPGDCESTASEKMTWGKIKALF